MKTGELMMSEGRLYLDTSAYFEDLCNQTLAPAIRKALKDRIICTSPLLLLEAERNLLRMSREGALTEEEYRIAKERLKKDSGFYILKDFSADLCLTDVFPPLKIPRSSDLAHLRTALWFKQNGGLDGFITLDKIQKMSAVDLGLPVIPLP